jgi:chromosomal replication initiation ATPase DnaA
MTATEIQIETESLKRENDALEELIKERRRKVDLQIQATDRTEAMTEITARVGLEFGITLKEIRGRRRFERVVIPRHVAMTLLYEMLDGVGLEDVGRYFGRDHGTVINAIRATNDRCETSEAIKAKVENCRAAFDTKFRACQKLTTQEAA